MTIHPAFPTATGKTTFTVNTRVLDTDFVISGVLDEIGDEQDVVQVSTRYDGTRRQTYSSVVARFTRTRQEGMTTDSWFPMNDVRLPSTPGGARFSKKALTDAHLAAVGLLMHATDPALIAKFAPATAPV